MTTLGWDDALDDFEDLLEQVQHAVELGHWEMCDFAALTSAAPQGEPDSAQRLRLAELSAEASELAVEIQRAQSAIRQELGEQRRGRDAHRAYLTPTP